MGFWEQTTHICPLPAFYSAEAKYCTELLLLLATVRQSTYISTQATSHQTSLHFHYTAMLKLLNIFGISVLFPNLASASQKTTYMTSECITKNSANIICEDFLRTLCFVPSKNLVNVLVVLFYVCNKQPILSLLFLKLGASGKIWALAASFAQRSQLTRGISHLQQHHRMLQLLKLLKLNI